MGKDNKKEKYKDMISAKQLSWPSICLVLLLLWSPFAAVGGEVSTDRDVRVDQNITRNGDLDFVVPLQPQPRRWEFGGGWLSCSADRMAVVPGSEPSKQEEYALECLQHRLESKGGPRASVLRGSLPAGQADMFIVAGTLGSNQLLGRLCVENNLEPAKLAAGFDGFIIRCVEHQGTDTVLLVGNTTAAVIYAVNFLAELIQYDDGRWRLPSVSVDDWAGMKYRAHDELFDRLGSGYLFRANESKTALKGFRDPKVYRYFMDWLVRFRNNAISFQVDKSFDLNKEQFRQFTSEANRRGINVFGGVRYIGKDNPDLYICYSDAADVERVMGMYETFIEAGCTGLTYLADDIEKEYLAGHCKRCIDRFGGLAGEQIYMLQKIVALARKHNITDDRVFFCPTYYHGYKKSGREYEYYQAFAQQKQLRKIGIFGTYYDEQTIRLFKQDTGMRYLWWYNGPRWINYVHKYRGRGQKGVDVAYYPLYYGWHGFKWEPTKGIAIDDQVVSTFSKMADLTEVGWLCSGDLGISHNELCVAEWGVYTWNPERFDHDRTERDILSYLCGPANHAVLERLNDNCIALMDIYALPAAKLLKKDYAARLSRARSDLAVLKAGYEVYDKPFGKGGLLDLYIQKTFEYYRQFLKNMDKQYLDKTNPATESTAGPASS